MLTGDVDALPAPLAGLSPVGALRGEPPRAIEHWIDAAGGAGLIRVSDDQYRTLSLTRLGRDVMDGRADDVSLAPPVAPLAKSGRRAVRDRRSLVARAADTGLRPAAFRPPAVPRDGGALESGVSAAGVSDALRAWRIEQARRRGMPPYVILHDRTLDAIASSLPRSRDELRSLPGIGPAKLDAYGAAILALVESVLARTDSRRDQSNRSDT
jgi:ATP-dependent DNA helicase RecQ